MQPSTWQRRGGAAGILAATSFVTESALLRHSPSTDQPTSDLTSYFSSKGPFRMIQGIKTDAR